MKKVNDKIIIELNLDESNDSSSETSNIIENDFENENLINNNDEIENIENENENINNVFNRSNENLNVKRTSNRKKSPVQRYGNPVADYIYIHYVNANVPNTFEEALNSSEFKEWQKAINSEIECLKKNNTWVVVDKPQNKKIIDVKWVYTRKSDDSLKARLVVRGFEQREYQENIYSPVEKMETLKILLSYCCENNLFIEQIDVETAFLNGKVKSEVNIYESQGYETGKNKVCK